MRRPERALAAGLLLAALVFAWAAATRPAGATLGTAYDGLTCQDPNAVANQFLFKDSFTGVANCAKLCLGALAVCQRDVKDAAACQLAFAADWISFDSQVDCAGLTGSDLSICKAGWAADLATWKRSILAERANAVFLCAQNNSTCLQCAGQ